MTINLQSITPSVLPSPPRVVLYGEPKVGKTTWASAIPGALFLDIEGGTGALNVARITKEQLGTYAQFMDVIQSLATQEHQFKVLVIDTLDWLEALIFDAAAAEHGKKVVNDRGLFGAGIKTAINIWRSTFEALDYLRINKNMPIIMLAHSSVVRFEDPMSDSYDTYTMKLHDKSSSVIEEWCDCILFAKVVVRTSKEDGGFGKKIYKAGGEERVLYTVGSPAYLAGNRYGLPPALPFTWEAFINALYGVQ